jgi:hypothetical protein
MLVSEKPQFRNDLFWFPAVPGIPISNQAKIARYFFASLLGDSPQCDDRPVMINDIDLLPLDRNYVYSFCPHDIPVLCSQLDRNCTLVQRKVKPWPDT